MEKRQRNKKEGTWYWFNHMHYIPLNLVNFLTFGLPWVGFRISTELFIWKWNILLFCLFYIILNLFCCCGVIVLQMQRHSQQELCGNTVTVFSIFQKVRELLENENIILKCAWVIENVHELLGKGDLQKFWVTLKQSFNRTLRKSKKHQSSILTFYYSQFLMKASQICQNTGLWSI